MHTSEASQISERAPRVAFVIGGVIEDWLDPLGVSLEEFCSTMMGSWLFGYVEALRRVGVDSVIVTVSRQVDRPVMRRHNATGAELWLLPATRGYLAARNVLEQTFSLPPGPGAFVGLVSLLRTALTELLSTPIRHLRETLRRTKVDWIIVGTYESIRFDLTARIGKSLELPVFGTFSGAMAQPRWFAPWRDRSLRQATGFIVCSQGEIDRLLRTSSVARSDVSKIYYPVDGEEWSKLDQTDCRQRLGLPAAPLIAIYHGAIDMHVKGLDTLLEAWDGIGSSPRDQSQPPPAILLIIGDGRDGERLEELIRQRDRNDLVFHRKWVHDRSLLRTYLSAADLYVFPSRADAFGISVLEAMASSLPVVASRARGIPEIFPDESSGGWVVSPGNVDELAHAVQELVSRPDLRNRMAREGRERAVTEFGMKKIGLQLRSKLFSSRARLEN